MAFVLKNRVLETCTSPGTGAVSLLGAVLGYSTFSSSIGNTNTTYYTIADQSGNNWEVGIGTYSTSGNTLARTTVIANSLGTTALINFSSGIQNVSVTQPAENTVVSNNNPGTLGYVLTSQGSGVAPLWQAVPVATAAYVRTSFTATVGQTTFSVAYTAPYIEVYQNGTLLNAADYTATNGTSVVLAIGASTGDIIEFIAYNVAIGGGGGTPGGSDTQIQFNSSGTFGANANFTYTNDAVNIPFGTSNSATSSAKIALALSMMS